MACALPSMTTSPVSNTICNTLKEEGMFRRSFSSTDLHSRTGMRRSYSDNHLCRCCLRASMAQPKLKSSRSMGFFNIQLSGTIIPDPLKSFVSDPETKEEHTTRMGMSDSDQENEMGIETTKRANWIERLVEIRNNWKEKQQKDDGDVTGETNADCEYDSGCEVDYDDDADGKMKFDTESFSTLLEPVSSSDTKPISKLAFLCNMAYVIHDMKTKVLWRYYGLHYVTSSLEKKAEASASKFQFERDTTRVPVATPTTTDPVSEGKERKHHPRSSAAFEIAASAASYVQSRAKDLVSLGSKPQFTIDGESSNGQSSHQVGKDENSSRVYKSEMAAYVAASTMTAVVAADEKQKQEAAKDLQSLHSAPCEWFVCDDTSIYTRCFVIQGSDSLASWQANLFFEPTTFEETGVLVHRGIYEAAKGIYEQFMPEIMQHLNRFGDRAKLQFTGHSLGGSLALLANLMLLKRKVVKPSALLPVVTFGSPFVFCGGQKILDELGVDDSHVHSVMMHRDIVPRAFSCTYPKYVAKVLKRLNGTFRSHPCLNKNRLLYSPMGKIFILQPDEESSPPHPLLPPGSALYALECANRTIKRNALKTFLNTPHPLETLSDPTAYGSDGTIIRDHDSSNYLKAVNEVIRQRADVRKTRRERNELWPLLTAESPHAWSHKRNFGNRLLIKEVMTGV